MVGEHRDVLAALAQRRHGDVHDVEAVEKVEAETGRGRLGAQIAVGGRHDADIDAARDVLADAPQLPFLYDAQQLGLRARRQLPDFIEKQRSAVRLLEHSRPLGDGAGESAARVTEQL